MSAVVARREAGSRLLARITTKTCAALAFFIAAMQCAAHAPETAAAPSVLIVAGDPRLVPGNLVADDTLRRTVPELLGRPVLIFSEYLEGERFADVSYAKPTADYLHRKYDALNVDVIVAFGAQALRFLLDYRYRIFPHAPIVHAGTSRAELRELVVPPDVVGWTAEADPSATLMLALRLHPRASRVIFVTGTSAWDHAWEGYLRKAAAGMREFTKVEFLRGLPTPEVLRQVHALTDEAIVFTPGYFLDGAGVEFTPRQSVERMASASGAPVYGPFDTFLGSGVVGGYMVPFADQATHAGAIVAALLSGNAPDAIPTGSLPDSFVADWHQLRRWSIDESALPAGSVVLFREPSLWVKYPWQIGIVAAALILQSLLVATLIFQHRARRKAEIALQQQHLELAHTLRLAALGEMTAIISHEINQPLGAILGNAEAAEMLLDSDVPSVDDLRHVLADIRRDDLRASEVVRRIRSLLQKHALQIESLNVNELVDFVARLVGAEAARREVAIEVQSAPVPVLVLGDSVQLQQLLLNLIMNAMDAMTKSPVRLRRVTLRVAHRQKGKVEIAVIDAGHGIESGTAKQLFDSFYTTKPEGLGLGLSIARTIAEAHGGTIVAENNPSAGSTFRVTLPEAPLESVRAELTGAEASTAGAR